jgi:hypothetical protein
MKSENSFCAVGCSGAEGGWAPSRPYRGAAAAGPRGVLTRGGERATSSGIWPAFAAPSRRRRPGRPSCLLQETV